VLDHAQTLMRHTHGIAHATIQLEPATHESCDEPGRCPLPDGARRGSERNSNPDPSVGVTTS
jgi:hypothetical protein